MSKALRFFIFCFALISNVSMGNPVGRPPTDSDFHVVVVSPRGEQRLEVAFMKEFQKLYSKPVRYSIVVPNVNDENEMTNLPSRIRNMKPGLIFTFGTPTTLAVAGTVSKPAISDIPIVFSTVSYPVKSGIVSDDRSVRKLVTGTTHLVPMQTNFEMMKKFSSLKKIGIVYNSTEPQNAFVLDELKVISQKFGVQVIAEPVDLNPSGDPDPRSISDKIKKVRSMGADWLYIGPDTFMGFTHRDVTTLSAIENGMLSFTIGDHPIRHSYAALGVVVRLEELGKYTAYKAFKVLNKDYSFSGVDSMYKFEILVNQCTLDYMQISPSSELSHLATYLRAEKGECKRPEIRRP